MDCAACKAPNPEGASYCNACGARLNLTASIDAAPLQDAIRREVETALKRDQKELQIAEFDITERVANRLLGWGKSLAFVLGALLLVGGFLGVKSAVDVLHDLRDQTHALVDTATAEVKSTTETLKTNVNSAQVSLNSLKTDMDSTQKDLDTLHNTFRELNSEKKEIELRYTQLKDELPHLEEIRNTLARYGSQLSDQGQALDVLSQQVQALVQDEASQSNRLAPSFPAAEEDYFHDMDRGIALTPDEIKGRNTWLVWTGGNDRLWDHLTNYSFGFLDLLKILSSYPTLKFSRDNRWSAYGLINEPCFTKATGPKPGAFGLGIDMRRGDCPPDPFEEERKYPGVAIGARGRGPVPLGSYYGFPSGVVGLRLFPNPAFDETAAKNWNAERYYTDPTYYIRNDLVRPYRVGISCGFCHVGFNPERPPRDPENPLWENLSSVGGNQFLWIDRIVDSRFDSSNYFFQLLHSYRPGTLDTSLVVTDYINNPRAITPIYNLAARLSATSRWNKDQWSKAIADDSGIIASGLPAGFGPGLVQLVSDIEKFYVNMGIFSEETLRHHSPVFGGYRQAPITAKALTDSSYWRATVLQLTHLVEFLVKASSSPKLRNAPGGAGYITADAGTIREGKLIFAENCAGCHSSKVPLPPNELSGCAGPGYLDCWRHYWEWTKTDDFKKQMRDIVLADDFLVGNYLSTDIRVPVTLLQTNICRSFSTNEERGNIWENFSSESYKDLPSIGSVTVYDPFTGKAHPFVMPAGGPGYTRVPTLSGIWSTAPFLLDNTVGRFVASPSVEGRMTSFQDAITSLLWPEKRARDPVLGDKVRGMIDRTTESSWAEIPGRYLPYFIRRSEASSTRGDLSLAVPRGVPVGLLTNIALLPDTENPLKRAEHQNVVVGLLHDLDGLPRDASDKQIRAVYANLAGPLVALTKCPDFVVGSGHYFGSSLSDSDKLALIEFLKTL